MKIPKNPLVLAAVAAAIYFLFIKGKGTAVAPSSAPPASTPTSGASAVIDAGTKLITEGIKAGSGLAKEAIGMEGMGPVTLNGMVASVGGLGDLGGSFYGGY